MNSVVELHDSKVIEINSTSASIVVRFGPAYVHRSEGRPGIDPGSGWVQDVDLIVLAGMLESSFSDLPQELDGGSLSVDGELFENTLPLPFDVPGAVRFTAHSLNGEELVIKGIGVTLAEIGDCRYVEQFSGANHR